jgi:hypothetical protein
MVGLSVPSSLSGRWEEGEVAASLHCPVRQTNECRPRKRHDGDEGKAVGVTRADGFAVCAASYVADNVAIQPSPPGALIKVTKKRERITLVGARP